MYSFTLQVDVGAEWDGLIPIGEEDWEAQGLVDDPAIEIGASLRVRVHALRRAGLFRFPLQLVPEDAALAARLPPPEAHVAPMDLRVMPA